MSWFKPKHKERPLEQRSRVEIVAHQKATAKKIKEVKAVNDQLNDMLERNGFTLKIFLAYGGKK